MGVFNMFTEDEAPKEKIRINIVGGPRAAKPGRSGIYDDAGNLVWSPNSDPHGSPDNSIRTFDTGATRSSEEGKLDFCGFLSPLALQSYAEYMHRHRVQPDGSIRDSDNWKKGIPLDSFMKSMWRHFHAVWKGHELGTVTEEDIDALFFNVHGYLHEWIKEKERNAALSGLRRSFSGFRPGT